MMHAHFPRRVPEYDVMERGEAERFNAETRDPFLFAVSGEPLNILELIERLEHGPEHEDYIVRAAGPIVEKMVCLFACDCYGPRSYNIHVFARTAHPGEQPGPCFPVDYGPGGAPASIGVAMLIVGQHSVRVEDLWYRCPLDLSVDIFSFARSSS